MHEINIAIKSSLIFLKAVFSVDAPCTRSLNALHHS